MNIQRDEDGNSVRFLAEDGRTLFEVTSGKDGRSIEVRGIETCKVDGVLYSESLSLEPLGSREVVIRTIPYDE